MLPEIAEDVRAEVRRDDGVEALRVDDLVDEHLVVRRRTRADAVSQWTMPCPSSPSVSKATRVDALEAHARGDADLWAPRGRRAWGRRGPSTATHPSAEGPGQRGHGAGRAPVGVSVVRMGRTIWTPGQYIERSEMRVGRVYLP